MNVTLPTVSLSSTSTHFWDISRGSDSIPVPMFDNLFHEEFFFLIFNLNLTWLSESISSCPGGHTRSAPSCLQHQGVVEIKMSAGTGVYQPAPSKQNLLNSLLLAQAWGYLNHGCGIHFSQTRAGPKCLVHLQSGDANWRGNF